MGSPGSEEGRKNVDDTWGRVCLMFFFLGGCVFHDFLCFCPDTWGKDPI